MEKDGKEKEQNILIVKSHLKENIIMEKDGMEKEKNILIMENYYLKVNI